MNIPIFSLAHASQCSWISTTFGRAEGTVAPPAAWTAGSRPSHHDPHFNSSLTGSLSLPGSGSCPARRHRSPAACAGGQPCSSPAAAKGMTPSALVSEQACKGRARPVHLPCTELRKSKNPHFISKPSRRRRHSMLDKGNGQQRRLVFFSIWLLNA